MRIDVQKAVRDAVMMAGLTKRGGFKGSDPLYFVLDQRACCMSGSETIASLWGVSRSSPTPSYAALADPKP